MELSTPPAAESLIEIREFSDAYALASKAKKLALTLGFTQYKTSMLASSVSEIAVNACRYATLGWASMQNINQNKGIEVTIEDNGSGIADIKKAFHDGFSTFEEGSLGLGLGAASRNVDELIINKSNATGTSIRLRDYLPVPPDDIEAAGISFPAEPLHPNGDTYIIKDYEGDKMLISIIDGAGIGDEAARSAHIVSDTVMSHYKQPLDAIIRGCDAAFREQSCERAVEMSLLRITPDTVEWAAIGNMGISTCSNPKLDFTIQDGSTGMVLPSQIHISRYPRPDSFCFALYSDGISSSGLSEHLCCDSQGALKKARVIFDNNSSHCDDATVVVIQG